MTRFSTDSIPRGNGCPACANNTLVRSYDWLSQNDIIFNRRGLGYFVSSGAVERIAEVRRHRFFHEQLPEMVRTMHALDIPFGDVTNEMSKLMINI